MSIAFGLNRSQRREAERRLSEENAKWPTALKEWPRDQWPTSTPNVLKVLRSRDFLVQVFPAPAPAIVRLSVLRAGIDSRGGWLQDIAWDDLQRLKSEAGYSDFDAVEVFPPDRDVVNVANIRHLWILEPGNLSFAWRATP